MNSISTWSSATTEERGSPAFQFLRAVADFVKTVKDLTTPDFERFKAWFRGYCGA